MLWEERFKQIFLRTIKNGQILDDHHLRVGKCTETQYPPSLSVFVGNLPAKVKEEDLWNFFGEDSNIKAVRVVRDKTTGKGKGVAFVMFESKDNVALALEKNNLEMNGRKIRVQRCQAKSGERMSNTHNRSKFRRKFHSKSGVLTNKAKKPKLKKMRKMKKALAKRQHIVEVLNKS
ncbi:RNA-binding protein 34-like protein [Leptotrombidium deliense]|uniref:RNA-binding protein 34-like protein n=1 Tax=Leptotrombidium deliense TaxID=299467 RepID=A0A443S7P7_9ACAR|nr:RNA-binding protein 34-like protein [Leptotrombidium deliense]